ncbi:hypothetical protein TI04_07195 [Achromatium sp. WMS2]|nr:hypothetical protein TI04_07195 [Achromatium sp. WMS2]
MSKFMILPCSDPVNIRLLKAPSDYAGQELFRHVTGIIAEVESRNPAYTWDDIAEQLELNGYEVVSFVLGPSQD